MQRIKIQFEHADGKVETFKMSVPVALVLIQRAIQPGWPFLTPIYEGKRLKGQWQSTENAFLSMNDEQVVIP